MDHRKRRWPWGLLAFIILAPGAIYGLQALLRAGATLTPSHPTANSSPIPTMSAVPTETIDGYLTPQTYWQACTYEASVCDPRDPSLPSPQVPLPAALWRPVQFPVVQPGQRCPTSAAGQVDAPGFTRGVALGAGPVRLLSPSVVDISPVPSPSGWYGSDAMTLWFSEPSYQGPWLLRGAGLDISGFVIFGDPPVLTSSLVVPPVDTLNTYAGYRTVPEGIYVRGPGCYAVQVDGLSFSYEIVFEAVTGQRSQPSADPSTNGGLAPAS